MPVLELPNPIEFPDGRYVGSTGAGAVLNQAGDMVALLFRAPMAGTITGLTFCTANVVTGCTLRWGLETVGAAYQDPPSGSYVAANVYGDVVVADGDDGVAKTVTFGAGHAVAAGDLLWATGRIQAGTPNALAIRTWGATRGASLPGQYKIQSGAASYVANGLAVCLTYDGIGDVHLPSCFTGGGASVSPSLGGIYNEVGAKITLPFHGRCSGVIMRALNLSANAEGEAVLYDDADNVLRSVSMPSNAWGANGQHVIPWAGLDLPPAVYRLVWKHTGASSWVNGQQYYNAYITPPPWLASYHFTHRSAGGGAWTDYTDRQPTSHFLLFDRLYLPDQSHPF